MTNMKICPTCGKKTRYQESDNDFEYWYSICEHLSDYKVNRDTGEEINEPEQP